MEPSAPVETEEDESMPAAEPIVIPPILLEGDQPVLPPVGGSVEKYALGPVAPVEPVAVGGRELPDAYGTGRLLLVARDPRWLYAHWDLTRDQQRAYNARSADRHLVVRVHSERPADQPVQEVHVHPESRHWFIEVERPATEYVAELGYYDKARRWTAVSTSRPVATPPEMRSLEKAAQFVTVPAPSAPEPTTPVSIPSLPSPAQPTEFPAEHPEPSALSTKVMPLSGPGLLTPPRVGWLPGLEASAAPAGGPAPWTEAKERALSELMAQPQSAGSSADLPGAFWRGAEQLSSALGGLPPGPAGFWLKVNAELVVYGATDPSASVTIGGQPIALGPDGTFSVRVALPDGSFGLPITAHAVSGELRQTELHFSRRTEQKGEVGELSPGDPANPPWE